MPELARLKEVLEAKPYLATLGLAGLLVLAAAGYFLSSGFSLGKARQDIEIFEADNQVAAVSAQTIFVDVGGAVINPGIYELPPDARVNDVLVAAGGLADEADHARISQNLNLAQKLTDGQKLYLPFKGEETVKDSPSQGKGESLNINTASLAELDTLWGVGPVTAQKIIDGRPYTRVEELLEKKIVKTNVYEAIKDLITVL